MLSDRQVSRSEMEEQRLEVDRMMTGVVDDEGRRVGYTGRSVRGNGSNQLCTGMTSTKKLLDVQTVPLQPTLEQTLVFFVHAPAGSPQWFAHNPGSPAQKKFEPRLYDLADIYDCLHSLNIPEGIYLGYQSPPSPPTAQPKSVRIICSPCFNGKVHYVVLSDQTEIASVQAQYPDHTNFIHMYQVLFYDPTRVNLCHPNEVLKLVVEGVGGAKRMKTAPDPLLWELYRSQQINALQGYGGTIVKTGSVQVPAATRQEHGIDLTPWHLECLQMIHPDTDLAAEYNKFLATRPEKGNTVTECYTSNMNSRNNTNNNNHGGLLPMSTPEQAETFDPEIAVQDPKCKAVATQRTTVTNRIFELDEGKIDRELYDQDHGFPINSFAGVTVMTTEVNRDTFGAQECRTRRSDRIRQKSQNKKQV